MADESQRVVGHISTNEGYNNAGIIQIRLDTELVLEKIEFQLRGQRSMLVFNPETQRPDTKVVKIGEPLANEEGIQSILQFVGSIINAQVVQGNMKIEDVRRFCGEKRVELAFNIGINRINWGIKATSIESICQSAFNVYWPFMTRTIDNKERESYSQYVHKDQNIVNQGSRSILSNPFGGNK
jgi:hypothetical protein